MPLGTEVGPGPGHIMLDGHSAPPQKGTAAHPIFGPCLSCQTAGWMKMKLGVELGLGPGHIVSDGYPAPLPLKGTTPLFSANVCCGQTLG